MNVRQISTAPPPRVLVVGCPAEHRPSFLETFASMTTRFVETPQLAAAARGDDAGAVELMVFDLRWAPLDDIGSVRTVAESSACRLVPTLFLADSEATERRALEGYGPAGMTDAVVGRVAPALLLAKARSLLELDRSRRAAARCCLCHPV